MKLRTSTRTCCSGVYLKLLPGKPPLVVVSCTLDGIAQHPLLARSPNRIEQACRRAHDGPHFPCNLDGITTLTLGHVLDPAPHERARDRAAAAGRAESEAREARPEHLGPLDEGGPLRRRLHDYRRRGLG